MAAQFSGWACSADVDATAMLNLNLLSRKALSFGGNYDRSGWNFWRGTYPRAVRWAFTD